MEENKNQIDTEQREPKRGSGNMLAAARKQQNRSVEEIADELNLSSSQIRSIELDQTEGLPEPTYVRGYIRSYAKLLGLDPGEVLEHYLNPNWQKGSRLDEMPRGLDHREDRPSMSFNPLKFAALLLVLAAAGFLFFSGQLDSLFNGQRAAQNPVATQTDVTPGNVANEPSEPLGQSPENITLADGGDAVETQAVPDRSDTEPTAAGNTENELVLSFTDTSWVDVRNAEGERLAYKSFAEGEILQLSSASTMSVFIGNASAVSAAVNGSDYDLSPHREGVFARFSVPQE